MAKVLGIGVATMDCVQIVEHYPEVDSELRAQQQHLWRGGNATNTLVVLSQLGEQCSWLGTLADDVFADIICADLEHHHIDYSLCPRLVNTTSPTSHILLSRESASRNIVHYRNLRELNEQDSNDIDFSQWDWIHFEGRNVEVTHHLMCHIRKNYPNVTVSLEIEKPRDGIETLFDFADCLFFSRHFANAKGFKTAERFLREWQDLHKQSSDLICAWGEEGASALSNKGIYFAVPALDIDVVDSRAAGDVFNAAYIHARLQGEDLLQGLEQACQFAGIKCSQLGLNNIKR